MTTSEERALRATWDRRDGRYAERNRATLTESEVDAVRTWRVREAEAIGSAACASEAWHWWQPAFVGVNR